MYMFSTTFGTTIVSILLCMEIPGPFAMARQCSPDQGQMYINEGRYRDAIREFSCLVEAQPTQVEG